MTTTDPLTDGRARCAWALGNGPEYLAYHDTDWGMPVRDERLLFELLILEGAQAGLSWETILRKRGSYRAAYGGFDPRVVAEFGPDDRERLLADPGIVRNRAKVDASILNASGVIALYLAGTTLVNHLWSFTGGMPLVNHFASLAEIPAETTESRAMSRDLKSRGFKFVGPTICYALMQSAGLVNDHDTGCFRWAEVQAGV